MVGVLDIHTLASASMPYMQCSHPAVKPWPSTISPGVYTFVSQIVNLGHSPVSGAWFQRMANNTSAVKHEFSATELAEEASEWQLDRQNGASTSVVYGINGLVM